MILGIPQFGPVMPNVEPVNLERAIKVGEISVKEPIYEADWRSEIAMRDGSWLVWWQIDEDLDLIARIGLIAHANNEQTYRDKGLVSVRPFTTPRTRVPVACIAGALDIKSADRAHWAHGDNKPAERVASAAKNDPWWIIQPDQETGAPMTVFYPWRWRATMNRLDETTLAGPKPL